MTSEPAETAARGSAWRPLRRPLFRAIWLASVGSQIGTWIHEVGAAWLMTSLTPSPLQVSLVQAALRAVTTTPGGGRIHGWAAGP